VSQRELFFWTAVAEAAVAEGEETSNIPQSLNRKRITLIMQREEKNQDAIITSLNNQYNIKLSVRPSQRLVVGVS
jgi:hypothetical protein